MIAEQTVSAVKDYHDIVSIISDYVQLKKKGRNHIGLCPFHSEKTPSFTVSAEKQIWHCFGCQKSGDHIGFVMQIDNISFAEAIIQIANKVGIEVVETENRSGVSYDQKQAIRDGVVLVKDAFQNYLEPESKAYKYLISRGLTEESIRDYQLGYSPSQFDAYKLMTQNGVSEEVIKQSGLFFERDDGSLHSRFRNRIIFPILDYQSRIAGFSGRVFETDDKKIAKYLNSEENPIFNKRQLLYGLNSAKKSIRELGCVILMEGFMDVIVAHQCGFKNAIGTMGTALTSTHAKKIKRFTSKVYLAMDSDEAGQQAIDRCDEVLKKENITTYVIKMEDKDPADTLLNNGTESFQELIDNPLPMIQYKLQQATVNNELDNIEEVSEILTTLLPFLEREPDPVIKKHYIKEVSDALKIDEELVMVKMKSKMYNIRHYPNKNSKLNTNKYKKAEEYLLFCMVSNPDIRTLVKDEISNKDLVSEEYTMIMQQVLSSEKYSKELIEDLEAEVKQKVVKIIFEYEEKQIEVSKEECGKIVKVINESKKKKQLVDIKKKLKELESSGNDEEIQEVLLEYQALMFKG